MADPDPLYQGIGFLIGDVARLLRRNFNRRARGLGLSQAQWKALAHLARQEGVSQAALAERLEIQPITLARLIDRLQAAGLVRRCPDPGDRRAFCLHLTRKAQPLLERMWRLAAETRQEALAGLPEERRKALLEALQGMKDNLLDAERGAASASGGSRRAATSGPDDG